MMDDSVDLLSICPYNDFTLLCCLLLHYQKVMIGQW